MIRTKRKFFMRIYLIIWEENDLLRLIELISALIYLYNFNNVGIAP